MSLLFARASRGKEAGDMVLTGVRRLTMDGTAAGDEVEDMQGSLVRRDKGVAASSAAGRA